MNSQPNSIEMEELLNLRIKRIRMFKQKLESKSVITAEYEQLKTSIEESISWYEEQLRSLQS